MYFLKPNSSAPIILDANHFAHSAFHFDARTGCIRVQLEQDGAPLEIGVDGHCSCQEYRVAKTCIHVQLASALLREPEKFRRIHG